MQQIRLKVIKMYYKNYNIFQVTEVGDLVAQLVKGKINWDNACQKFPIFNASQDND